VNAVTSGEGLRLVPSAGKPIDVEALILALPAYRAARVLAALTRSVADLLAGVRYAPSRTVNLAYRAEQVRRPLEGTGFVVAPTAAIPLRACTYASRKFPHRAPDDHALLRAFLESAADDAPQRAHDLLTAILDIRGSPLWHRCVEWPRGLPAYAPDHADRLARARAALARLGPVFLAGAGYDGAGVSACVRSGRAAARDALSGRAAPAAASSPPPP
jgi:oxygen-dependent protoporphyrinogen oxidase